MQELEVWIGAVPENKLLGVVVLLVSLFTNTLLVPNQQHQSTEGIVGSNTVQSYV